jgi:biotin operon repressor
MKKIREYLVEKFKEDSDPISDMNIGIRTQIINDLKKIGLSEADVDFEDDGTFFIKEGRHRQPDNFLAIQEKYFPFAQKVLLHNLEHSKLPINKLIDQARTDGLDFDQIENIIKKTIGRGLNFNHLRYNESKSDVSRAKIYIAKLKRTMEEEQEDDENNIYIFIGYTDKVPTVVNGKKYYEDKFAVENMVKIDKFDAHQLAQVSMMKLRLRFQPYEDGAVYMLRVPKEIMDEDHYYKIPDHLYDIVEKYKKKI